MYISLDCTNEELRAIINDLAEVSDHRKKLIDDMAQIIKMQKETIDNLRLLNKSVAGIPNVTLTNKPEYVSYDNVSGVFDAKPY